MKKLFLFSFLIIATPHLAFSASQENPKDVVLNCFRAMFESSGWSKAEFNKYFAKNYIQVVDGKKLNYDQHLAHIKALKRECKLIQTVFHDMIVQGSKVATRHTAHAIKKDGSQVELNVMAIFEVKDGKLVHCDELTQLVKGKKTDAGLGSRY